MAAPADGVRDTREVVAATAAASALVPSTEAFPPALGHVSPIKSPNLDSGTRFESANIFPPFLRDVTYSPVRSTQNITRKCEKSCGKFFRGQTLRIGRGSFNKSTSNNCGANCPIYE